MRLIVKTDRNDAELWRSNVSWPALKTGNASTRFDNTYANTAAASLVTGTYTLKRYFMSFDTREIPQGSIIRSITLNVRADFQTGGANIGPFLEMYVLRSYLANPLRAPWFNSVFSTSHWKKVDFDHVGSAKFTLPVKDQWYEIPLNAEGLKFITPEGYTQLCITSMEDVENIAPQINKSQAIYAGDTSNSEPYLVIEYDPPKAALIGKAQNSAQVEGTTLTLTPPTQGFRKGSAVIISLAIDNHLGNVRDLGEITCTDSKGNIYTVDADREMGDVYPDGTRSVILSALNIKELLPIDTITITHPRVVSRAAIAACFLGLKKQEAVDKTLGESIYNLTNVNFLGTEKTSLTDQAEELVISSWALETQLSANFFYLNDEHYFEIGRIGTDRTSDYYENVAALMEYKLVNARDRFSSWITDLGGSGDWSTHTMATYKLEVANVQKSYFYKVYTSGVLVKVWHQDVISEPNFKSTINGGVGELTVQLARKFDEFGEDDDVKLNNKVECYVVDKDNPNGLLLYSGYISGYKPTVQEEREFVDVTVLGYIAELQRMVLRDTSGNTTLTYNSFDPANILKDVINKYRAMGGTINFSSTSISLTNTVVSYTFNANTVKEALDKIVELCPIGWYWRVDPDNTIYLAPKNAIAEHTFNLGLNIENLGTFRRIEDLVNRVLFTGGGTPALFRKYENTSSIAAYGLHEKKITDQRVTTVATAGIMSNRIIDNQKDPEIRSNFLIIDNNGPQSRGYNIESVKPGQTLKVANLKSGVKTITYWDQGFWDVDVWDQTIATTAADIVQILSVGYSPDSIVIEASSRLPQIAKRIEDVQRNLEVTQSVNNPAAPS